ncbi:MAG TPA: ABC transporter permease subunit [Vicinamibacterales bacterium]|nr:ABC transporter permease subunit [Vicinamibacterales bacterium]
MRHVVLVAKNAFRAVMSQRALYMWGFAVVIMFLRSGPALFAQPERGPEFVAFLRANAVSGSLDLWSYLCMGGAIYLGASSIASELRSKTIITVLSHPVRRWQMLIGKWIGVSAFCAVTLGIGIALGYGLARYLEVNIEEGVLAISATRTIAGIVLFAGLATAMSTMGSAPIAVAVTMFFAIVPQLIPPMREYPNPIYQRIGAVLDAVVAPGYQSHYNGVVWAAPPIPPQFRDRIPAAIRQRPTVDYGEQRRETAKIAAYAGAYFLLGCVAFTRRDLKFG